MIEAFLAYWWVFVIGLALGSKNVRRVIINALKSIKRQLSRFN